MPHSKPDLSPDDRWPLADAKARFDVVMRRARETGPQRVTVQGHDTVVVLDIAQYERLVAAPSSGREPDGAALIAIMAAAPSFDEIDLERPIERSPVRDVAL